MKASLKNNRGVRSWLVGMMVGGLLSALPLQAVTISIVNPGFEDPEMSDPGSGPFDGSTGATAGNVVPGWESNEASLAGPIHHSAVFPGRTGNNVMYLHGSAEQNFHTAGFDLGVDLQSNTTYTLTFDVMQWVGLNVGESVIFRAGVYTGSSYENRVALVETAGSFAVEPNEARTITLTFTTEAVAEGTKFWIGGDNFGNPNVIERAYFDNFALTAVPEPSSVALAGLGCIAGLGIWRSKRKIA